jgi:hypothetical protein
VNVMRGETFPDEWEALAQSEVYEREPVNIEERVRQLYAQSGGPEKAAKRIEELMRQHLLYGKDHGRKGTIETYSDAIDQLFAEDRSLNLLQSTLNKWRFMLTTLFQMQNERMNRFLRALEDHNKIMEKKMDALIEALKEQKQEAKGTDPYLR